MKVSKKLIYPVILGVVSIYFFYSYNPSPGIIAKLEPVNFKSATYEIRKGDTYENIYNRNLFEGANGSPELLRLFNNGEDLRVGMIIKIPLVNSIYDSLNAK